MLATYRSKGRVLERVWGLYIGNLQALWSVLERVCGYICNGKVFRGVFGHVWCCMLATHRSDGACWSVFEALMVATYRFDGACWSGFEAVLQVWWGMLERGLRLYVGNLQVLWGVLKRVWGCMLATYRFDAACWSGFEAVCWEPTGLTGRAEMGLGLYVGNLQVWWGMLERVWGCMLGTYRSYGACWNGFGAVCWQPTGLMRHVGAGLRLYVGNLQVLWGVLKRVWGCMLATYRFDGACWSGFEAVCWEPTSLMGRAESGLGLYVGNLEVWWGMLERKRFGAVCWQPTGLMGHVAAGLRLYVGNLQVLWGVLKGVWGCMLATYRFDGACWSWFEAVCWELTGLMGRAERGLGAVCWQPTGLMGHVAAGLRLYVGNLQVLWGVLKRVWGCMLATYRFDEACWSGFEAVCWELTGLMGRAERGLGLYVGNLQVWWGMLQRVWGCMLGTYRSYGACWKGFGAVCWQPTGLMRHVGAGLRLYVGNLQVLWGVLKRVWGFMLATYRFDGACCSGSEAVCLEPTGLMGACWKGFGAVCWQPTGLMGHVGAGLRLYVGNLQVLWGVLKGVWGCMLATYRFDEACWSGFEAVCWELTGLMGRAERGLGLYVGNLQVWWGMLEWVWGCMMGTYRSYGACWNGFGAVCWQPTVNISLILRKPVERYIYIYTDR